MLAFLILVAWLLSTLLETAILVSVAYVGVLVVRWLRSIRWRA